MPFVPFDFVILPPGHSFWSLPIVVHCNILFRVTFGYFGSIKNLLGSLNFFESFPKVQQRTLFLNPLKGSKNLNQKRFFIEPKMVLNHIFGTIFGSVFYFLELFCSLRVLLREKLQNHKYFFFHFLECRIFKGCVRNTLKYSYSTTWKNLGPMSRG